MRLVLIVEGGCLCRVFAENPDELDVTVVDYDVREDLANSAEVPQGDGTTETADVWPAIAEPLPEHLRVWLGVTAGAA